MMPPTLQDVCAALAAPFPIDAVQLRYQSKTKAGDKILAVPYVDKRAVERRLDSAVGPDNWSVVFKPWGDRKLICELTVCGVTKSSTGECNEADPNEGTIAEAQAFKRAAECFGVGSYLYEMERLYVPASQWNGYKFENEAGLITQLYKKAGISLRPPARETAKPEAEQASEQEREEKAQRLVSIKAVKKVQSGYEVTDGKRVERVTRDISGAIACTCEDYIAAMPDDAGYRCVHKFAVRISNELNAQLDAVATKQQAR